MTSACSEQLRLSVSTADAANDVVAVAALIALQRGRRGRRRADHDAAAARAIAAADAEEGEQLLAEAGWGTIQ